jgi:hypothetical protein
MAGQCPTAERINQFIGEVNSQQGEVPNAVAAISARNDHFCAKTSFLREMTISGKGWRAPSEMNV